MTATTVEHTHVPLRHPRLPRFAPLLVLAVAGAAAAVLGLALHWGLVPIVLVALLIFLVALPLWSTVVENRRSAVDRLVTSLIWVALAVAVLPLVSMLARVIAIGAPQVTTKFLTYSMRNVITPPGGIYHAIIGTLLITLGAAIISIPVGLLSAIYLVEYGKSSRLARAIRFLVDVMTGIPSIVAGLFAYALFSLILGAYNAQAGIAGSVALSILMIPIVVRSAEEMLKLVPDELREASYALGVPKWRTITKVVLPTALAGIITGVTLSIARVIGETAPLLIVCGATDSTNFDMFNGQMASIPVFIYTAYGGTHSNAEQWQQMAWGAAFVLILVVLLLNLLARVLGKIFAPKGAK